MLPGLEQQVPKIAVLHGAHIELQLDRLLNSQTFQRAPRLRSLLRYAVQLTIRGEGLNEMRAAIELFGKDSGFEPSLDPIVRVQFGRLRKALAHYYEIEGADDPICITIPPRSYTPEIEVCEKSQQRQDDGQVAAGEVSDGGFKRPPSHSANRGGSGKELDGTPTLLILPFTNLTNDDDRDVFCYGLTEEISTCLAQKGSLRIVANNSAFQYKDEAVDVREVGQELGAAFVMEGSVRIEEDKARVTAQIARVTDGVAIWSNAFDGALRGSLDTQSELAKKIAGKFPDLD